MYKRVAAHQSAEQTLILFFMIAIVLISTLIPYFFAATSALTKL
jgi:hypothetical protein